MDRMTDEEIGDIEKAIWGTEGVVVKHCQKLLHALKAERKSLNDCARDNTKFRQRISELEAVIKEVMKVIARSDTGSLEHYPASHLRSDIRKAIEPVKELSDE